MKPLLALILALPVLAATPPVTASHPRIWITPTILSNLQANAAMPTATYTALKNYVDTFIYNAGGAGACAPGTSVTDDRFNIGPAMVYLMTGTAGYGDCARKLLLQKGADMCPVGVFGGNGLRHSNACYGDLNDFRGQANIDAVTFDWIYPRLSSGDKTTIVGRFVNAATNFNGGGGGTSCPSPNGGATGPPTSPCPYTTTQVLQYTGGNLQAGNTSTIGLIGMSTYGDNASDNTMTMSNDQTDLAFLWYTNYVKPWATTYYGVGGAFAEGPEYGPQTLSYYFYYFDAVLTSGGTSLYTDIGATFFQNVVKWYTAETAPTTSTLPCAGPSQYNPMSWGDQQQILVAADDIRIGGLRLAANSILGSTYSAYERFYLNTYNPTYDCGSNTAHDIDGPLFNFMYDPTGLTATDYRSVLPASYYASGMMRVESRPDWTSNATWVYYSGYAPGNDHDHNDVGAFTIYRKGQYLTTEAMGYGSTWQSAGLHNEMELDGNKSSWNSNLTTATLPPSMLHQEFDSNNAVYSYLAEDATNSYNNANLSWTNVSLYQRELVHLFPDYVVVFDRVQYGSASTSNWYLNFPAQSAVTSTPVNPSISSNIVTGTNSGQVLYSTTLQPTSPTITKQKFGTDVTQLWDNGALTAVDAGANSNYRIKVTSGVTTTAEQYLHVLQASDVATSVVSSERIAPSGIIAAHIKDTNDDKFIGFTSAANGAAITLPASYSFTAAASTDTHFIADLTPSSTVNVTRTKVGSTVSVTLASSGGGTNIAVTSGGVLCFNSSLTACSAVPPPSCSITPTTAGPYQQNVAISTLTFNAVNCGMGTLTWTSSTLPTGLSGCNSVTGTSCSITGTPTVVASFASSISVTDGGTNSASISPTIVVNIGTNGRNVGGRQTKGGKITVH